MYIYKMNNEGIKETSRITTKNIIILSSFNMEEIDKISTKTNIDKKIFLKAKENHIPRIDNYDGTLSLTVDIPYTNDDNYKHKYGTESLNIIVNEDYFVVLMDKNQFLINEVLKVITPITNKELLTNILFKVTELYQNQLLQINEHINNKEKALSKSTNNKELLFLLDLEKTLVYFTTSLKENENVLESLDKLNILNETENDILDDAIIKNKQNIHTANIYREILTSMSDVYATIISNNLNDIMKFLAGITIVFSIPTMVASFMGMNVPLGTLGHNDTSFILIIILSFVLSVFIAILLRKKNML